MPSLIAVNCDSLGRSARHSSRQGAATPAAAANPATSATAAGCRRMSPFTPPAACWPVRSTAARCSSMYTTPVTAPAAPRFSCCRCTPWAAPRSPPARQPASWAASAAPATATAGWPQAARRAGCRCGTWTQARRCGPATVRTAPGSSAPLRWGRSFWPQGTAGEGCTCGTYAAGRQQRGCSCRRMAPPQTYAWWRARCAGLRLFELMLLAERIHAACIWNLVGGDGGAPGGCLLCQWSISSRHGC